MPDEQSDTPPDETGGSSSPADTPAGRTWAPWVLVAAIIVAVLVVMGILLATRSDEGAPGSSPDASAAPSPSAEPSLEAWCEAYSPAVVLIQTFGTFPSPASADDLLDAVSAWAAVAPPKIKDATGTVVAEYSELAEITKTGDEADVKAKANEMAANEELKTAVDDVARYYGTNCPDGIPPEEQEGLQ